MTLAAVVALVSHGLSAGELAALERISRASGVSDEELAALVDGAEAALNGR